MLILYHFSRKRKFYFQAVEDVRRIGGANRYETAVLLAQEAYAETSVVVVASGETQVDALADGVLSAHAKAPLILVSKQAVPDAVHEAIGQWQPERILLLGGENTISLDVEEALAAFAPVQRIAGATRYETAHLIREEALLYGAHDGSEVVVSGTALADSLVAGPFAFGLHGTLTLYSPETTSYAPWIVGGEQHVPKSAGEQRLSGADRIQTSLAVAKHAFANAETVLLVNGNAPSDALSAMNLAVELQAPIVYANQNQVTPEVQAYLKGKEVILIGGEGTLAKDLPWKLHGMRPNELGEIMILMYHHIGHPTSPTYNVSADEFRHHLKVLYENKYVPIRLSDYIDGKIDIPLGYSPYILTFDDGNANNFWYKDDGTVDPDCGVGMIMEFAETHKHFKPAATFFLNKDAFRQPDLLDKKIEFLYANGMEVGNHTYDHPNLSTIDATETQR